MQKPQDPALDSALVHALERARAFQGATSPNPPVGACALDSEGRILSAQAHEKAGTAHAEIRVLEDCAERGLLQKIHTLVVTLEPCNHQGRTPPCTEGILKARENGASVLRKVAYGASDPNPRVAGGGAKRLRDAGMEVIALSSPACEELIRPWAHWIQTERPWVTLKTVWRVDSRDAFQRASMIPPDGQKTFSSPTSLKLAHELRKRSDAILTGVGTVLSDSPEFTVRHVPDHLGKKRLLVVMDRQGKTPSSWIQSRQAAGFEVLVRQDLEKTLLELGKRGIVELLVEAGPALSGVFLSSALWNQHFRISVQPGEKDLIEVFGFSIPV